MGSMDEIVREFLVESYENLDQLDQDLVALERSPGSRELLSRVFRTIHTIKGACGFLGFGRLESLTHVGESLLSELRDGRRVMDQLTTDVLLHMVDTVREILASIEASGGERDIVVDGVIEQIRTVLQEPAAHTVPDVDTLAGTGSDALGPACTASLRSTAACRLRCLCGTSPEQGLSGSSARRCARRSRSPGTTCSIPRLRGAVRHNLPLLRAHLL